MFEVQDVVVRTVAQRSAFEAFGLDVAPAGTHATAVPFRGHRISLSRSDIASRMVTPDLRQMRYVVEVERERSFSRAGRKLHVAQQAVSQQIKVVEDELGVQLFERTSRGVEPTAAGEAFVQEARRALSAAERVAQRAQAAA